VRERKQPEEPQPEAAEERLQKPIEKIKADNEKHLKSEMEKLVVKELKHEAKEHKIEKIEIKEHKLEKFEIKEHKLEKFEHKELKIEAKELKPEKEKLEIKEHKPELEKAQVIEGPLPPGPESVESREALLRHAETLEESARQIRHFIDQGERPDLSRGALGDDAQQKDE
jgi:hypothetical protein